jgi:hypothetical protein
MFNSPHLTLSRTRPRPLTRVFSNNISDTFHEKAKSSVQFTDDLFYTSPDRHASIRTFVKGSPLPGAC